MCLGEIAQVTDVVDDRTVRVRVGERSLTVSLLTLDGPVAPATGCRSTPGSPWPG